MKELVQQIERQKLLITQSDRQFLQSIHTWKHNNVVNEDCLAQFRAINAMSVIDVGPGDGFWGKVIKYVCASTQVWGVQLEVSYIQKWQLNRVYDKIINNDIALVIPHLKGQLILMGDVLEHLQKEDAVNVLKTAVDNFSFVMVNAPIGFQRQDHQISSQIHRCGLSWEDFKDYNILRYIQYPHQGDVDVFHCLIEGIKN